MDPELDEMDEMEYPEGAEYELTNIMVDSVGLVPKGANMQSFFLLKQRKESDMPDELNIEEVAPETLEDGDNVIQKIIKGVTAGLSKSQPQAPPEPEPSDEQPAEEPVDEAPEPEPTPEPTAPTGDLEKILKSSEQRFEALLKAQKADFTATVTKMAADLEKAQNEAKEAKEWATSEAVKVAKQVSLEKAREFRALPVATTDLGDLIYDLEKALPKETLDKTLGLLQSADKLAWTAGIFKETGRQTVEQLTIEKKVEKMMKDEEIPYEEALLKLSPTEQLELMKEADNG